ncbi:peptide/nickel transport system substrate-binding protein [Enhydrobacter aerosaccus]|uniref:Peptide/nickel transport system substrate-binding protein n=1 Tax=Enhydrobacter aerosaccus TaxID=225324 RepID=A0A1T4K766_9HYPH|nr:ABC transporter substrate-binding protein [Enhydrobacter aerosaccus]SJZ38155.1 peptide/nickel transport system substrate-binding protein [Enhydrobacter aerosaccus]
MTAAALNRRALLAASATLPFLRIPAVRAATPGLLTFGLSSYPPTLQPWANGGTASSTIKLMIHRGLTSFSRDGNPQPELAESWSRDDEKTWVFKLRDARFHNGEKVTAADVQWTFDQIADEKSTAYFRAEMQRIAKVEAPDARTVRLVTKQPLVTVPNWLANFHMPIVSRSSPKGSPIGAGPFVPKGQERGVSIDLERFDAYYKPGLPKLKAIRAIAYADENLRLAALRSGDVDLIEYVPWQAMDAIAGDPALKLDAVDGPFMYLVFNGSRPPFNDARVRRAVAHAIKREELVKAAFFGRGSPLEHLPISESSSFYNADFKNGWHYDPDLSKRLLAEAGHGGGLSCSLLSTAQYGMHKDSAEIVQQHLAAVGINATLNLPDWATRVNLGNRGQYEIGIMGNTAESNDPDGLAAVLDGSLAASYVRSFGLKIDSIIELMEAGRTSFDEAKRRTIYRNLEQVAIDQAPIVGLTWRSQGYAMRKDVAGFSNFPGALTFYSGETFETTTTA